MQALRVCAALGIRVTLLFANPTANSLARALKPANEATDSQPREFASLPLPELDVPTPTSGPISVAGMALRLPGAASEQRVTLCNGNVTALK